MLVPVLDRSFELLLSSPCDLLASLSLSLQRLKRLGRAAVCLLLILISDLDAEPIDLPDHQALQFFKKEKRTLPINVDFATWNLVSTGFSPPFLIACVRVKKRALATRLLAALRQNLNFPCSLIKKGCEREGSAPCAQTHKGSR